MRNWFIGLEPREVYEYFDKLSMIPRATGDMEAVSDAVLSWIKELGLEVSKDEYCNVKAFKSASAGYENCGAVMFTAHLDMVCAKVDGSDHDFTKDPIDIILEDGGKITADGTTLGADDGMGVAMILAILADKTLPHPALEVLFTTNEETDMNGALKADYSDFKSTLIINLDGDPIGIAGAGELDTRERFAYKEVPVIKDSEFRKITVSGLQGGHSGMESTKERGNAVMLLNRVLRELSNKTDMQLCYIKGGNTSSTAIAYYSEAIVALSENELTAAEEVVKEMNAIFLEELRLRDEGVNVSITEAQTYETAVDKASLKKLITLLASLPEGVNSRDLAHPGLMESSVNTGVCYMENGEFVLATTIRSAVKSKKYYLYDRICLICEALGVDLSIDYDLPQWDMKVSDEILELCRKIYPDCPIVIEEGTGECGVFSERMPNASVISLQCPYKGAHSTNESIMADDVEKYYERLKTVLKELK